MGDNLGAEQQPVGLEGFQHLLIGLENFQPFEDAGLFGKASGFVHGAEHFQPPFFSGVKILFSVAGSDVHDARAGGHIHKIGGDDGPGKAPVAGHMRRQAMSVFQARQLFARNHRAGTGGHARFGHESVSQLIRHHQVFPVRVQEPVVLFIRYGRGHIGRQRPGSGGPDNYGDPAPRGRGAEKRRRRIQERKLDKDRRGGLVLIFNFGVGQGRLAGDAPVNCLFIPMDIPFLEQFPESFYHGAFVIVGHGDVGAAPVAQYAQPLEFLALDVHEFAGEFPGLLPESGHVVDMPFPHLQLFQERLFDREPVAVPARHIRRVMPREAAGFHHHVLQDLIEGVADMDMAVGVRRPVVQDIGLGGLALFQHLLVKAYLAPEFQQARLFFSQVRFHRKSRFRQEDRFGVIHVFSGHL